MTKPEVVVLWDAVKAWFAEHLPEILETLNPGASEAVFDAFNDGVKLKTGLALSEDVRALYLENDGQRHGSVNGVWLGLEFLSLENVREQWRDLCAIAEETDMNTQIDGCTSYPKGAIQTLYACPGWVPIAYDWGGNHIGVDVNPGPSGRVGQVINCRRDEENKFVMAPSLAAFLEWQLAQLQGGNYVIRTETSDGQLERHLEIRKPHNAHLLDAVPELFGPKRRGFLWRPRK